MKNYNLNEGKQRTEIKRQTERESSKRVNIVSLKLVKESSFSYKNRTIRSLEDGYLLLKQFIQDADREHFIVVCLDIKNQPTAINIFI